MLAKTVGTGSDERALAAMAFADVVNFSAMMAADERRTFAAVRSLLDSLVAPAVAAYRGVIVKGTGDGLLARFRSALDAVEWAEEVQCRAPCAAGSADGGPVQLRISINLGDLISSGGDIFGDGVNVAARLIEHAPRGGIALSEAVHEMVRGSVASRVIDLGLRPLKSFARPVRVFALTPCDTPPSRAPPTDSSVPSIAVLPLENLGGDPNDNYFADGVVEDIIVSLAGLGELSVVSHASTIAFARRRVDPREVGRALGVRYVAMGSVRRTERCIRVGMQLCDVDSGRASWSEVAEDCPGDLFNVQDRIVGKIVTGIAPNVRTSELRRALRKQPGSLSAYDHTLRGLHLIHSFDAAEFVAARASLAAAIEEDPHFAMPRAWLAWWHMLNVGQGWAVHPESDAASAGEHAARAIELDSNNALALAIQGHVKSFLLHQFDLGLMFLDRALKVSPSCAVAWVLSATSLAYIGQGEHAVRNAERALKLSPLDRNLFLTHNTLCLAHYVCGSFDEAVRWGRLAFQSNPNYTTNHRWLIASLVANGEVGEEARLLGRRMLQLDPHFNLGQWERTLQPFRDQRACQHMADRLRLALEA